MQSIKEEILALLSCNGFLLGLLWIRQNSRILLSIWGGDYYCFGCDLFCFVPALIVIL